MPDQVLLHGAWLLPAVWLVVIAITAWWWRSRFAPIRKPAPPGLVFEDALFNELPVGLALCRMDGSLVRVNPAFARLIGRTVEETCRLTYWQITPEKYAPQEQQQLDSLLRLGRYGPYEKEYIHRDGHLIPVLLRGILLEQAGEQFIWSFVENMADNPNSVASRQLRAISAHVPAVVCRFALTGASGLEVAYVSDMAEHVFGLNAEGREFLDRLGQGMPPDDRSRFERTLEEAAANCRYWEFEGRFTRPDGETIWFSVRSSPHREEGVLLYDSVLMDVTDRMEVRQELESANRFLKLVLDTIPARVFWKDCNARYLGGNRPFMQDAQLADPSELVGRDDFDMVWSAQARECRNDDFAVIQSRLARINYEEPRSTESGTTRWLLTSKAPIQDESGAVIGVLGAYQDITERKQAEESLRLSQLMMDQSCMAIFRLDETGSVRWVNEAACRSLGYTRQELEQLSIPDFDSLWTRDYFDQEGKHLLIESGRRRFETRHRRKNGTEFPVEVDNYVIDHDQGRHIIAFVSDISARKAAEEALRDSVRTLGAIFEASPVAILALNRDGRVAQFSPAAERLFGYRADEVVGKIYPVVPQGEKAGFEQIVAQIMRGDTFVGESVRQRKDGSRFDALISTAPLRDEAGGIVGLVGVVQDVTEVKKAQAEMRLTQAAVAYSATAIIRAEPDSSITYVNAAACRLTGYSQAELCAMKLEGLDLLWQNREKLRAMELALRARGSVRIESEYRRKDGTLVPVEVTGYRANFEGRDHYFAFVADISERLHNLEEKQRLEEQMLHAQKLESLGVLAGGIAHDFNNLLAAIRGNLELMKDQLSGDAPARDYLDQVEVAVTGAAQLANQMLAYSGRGRFVVAEMDLNQTIQEMSQMLQASISKKVALISDLAPDLSAVEADAAQIRQLLLNLIVNASEAIGDLEGRVELRTGMVHCSASALRDIWVHDELAAGTYVYFEVSDTGCGIPEERLPRIFEPFYTTKFTGRGLGMAAVLGIVRGHKGAITIQSRVDVGTTFRVLLPALDRPFRAIAEKPAVVHQPSGGTVLLVDDEESIRVMAGRMLAKLGYDVVAVADGREAVARFPAIRDRIVLAIVDMTMPHMDGEETFHALRAIQPDLRVVISSGYSEFEIAERFRGEDLAGVLKKPFSIDELGDAVRVIGRPCLSVSAPDAGRPPWCHPVAGAVVWGGAVGGWQASAVRAAPVGCRHCAWSARCACAADPPPAPAPGQCPPL